MLVNGARDLTDREAVALAWKIARDYNANCELLQLAMAVTRLTRRIDRLQLSSYERGVLGQFAREMSTSASSAHVRAAEVAEKILAASEADLKVDPGGEA